MEPKICNLRKWTEENPPLGLVQRTEEVPFIKITYSVSHFIKIPLKGEVGGAKQVEGQQEGLPRRQGEGGD